MSHDQMIQAQVDLLFKNFPETKKGTVRALNADGILWVHEETSKVYYVNKGKVTCLS